MTNNNKTIFITGGAGFIGSNLIGNLINKDNFIIVLDSLDPYYDPRIKKSNISKFLNKKNFVFIKGDIRDSGLLKDIVNKYSPQYVVHLASKVGVRNSIEFPFDYLDVNVKGTINVLEAIKNQRIVNFIFSSSSSVYGANENFPFKEDDVCNSQLSPYAASKISAELFCRQYDSFYGIPTTILRFFTVYGKNQRPDLAISKFINSIKQGKTVKIFGSGSQLRDFIYIDDITEGILKTLNTPRSNNIINLGTGVSVSINALLALIENKLHKTTAKKYFKFHKSDIFKTQADIKQAKLLLGWKPRYSLEEGLNKILCAE